MHRCIWLSWSEEWITLAALLKSRSARILYRSMVSSAYIIDARLQWSVRKQAVGGLFGTRYLHGRVVLHNCRPPPPPPPLFTCRQRATGRNGDVRPTDWLAGWLGTTIRYVLKCVDESGDTVCIRWSTVGKADSIDSKPCKYTRAA